MLLSNEEYKIFVKNAVKESNPDVPEDKIDF
jgi:hypothetical protein